MNNKREFKVIIAGGRDFNDYGLLLDRCDGFLAPKMLTHDVLIVSGTANGADQLGERYAKERCLKVISFPADWNAVEGKPKQQIGYTRNGKAYWKLAGHVRNSQMGDYSDCLIAFWNGSKGTKGMIDYMKKLGKPMRIVDYV